MPNMFDDNPKYFQFDSEIIKDMKEFMQNTPAKKWMGDDVNTVAVTVFSYKYGDKVNTDQAWRDWNESKVVMPAWERCAEQAAKELGILEDWKQEVGEDFFHTEHTVDDDPLVLLPSKDESGDLHVVSVTALLKKWRPDSSIEIPDEKIQGKGIESPDDKLDGTFLKALGDDIGKDLDLGEDFPPLE